MRGTVKICIMHFFVFNFLISIIFSNFAARIW